MPINCHYNKKIGKIIDLLNQFEWLNALKRPKNFNVGFFSFAPNDK